MKNLTKITTIAFAALILTACKKDDAATIELKMAVENPYLEDVQVNLQEVWLNYTTKKSNSEWVQLDIKSGVYNLSQLYIDQKDTVIMEKSQIEGLNNLLQLRFVYSPTNSSAITAASDTVDLQLSSNAINGAKMSINKNLMKNEHYRICFTVIPDSSKMMFAIPTFDPKIQLDSLKVIK